eukprot:TRINITY_DN1029_c0_g3_i1.p1 TRINITY_DN1029_c0_g3~~TRINITY_DN1029_c0_g3_i1.p1  ORF type:complete len:1204 (-),score=334.87 TRINITY_DN1029_c0_g3_i1:1147-4758(-)
MTDNTLPPITNLNIVTPSNDSIPSSSIIGGSLGRTIIRKKNNNHHTQTHNGSLYLDSPINISDLSISSSPTQSSPTTTPPTSPFSPSSFSHLKRKKNKSNCPSPPPSPLMQTPLEQRIEELESQLLSAHNQIENTKIRAEERVGVVQKFLSECESKGLAARNITTRALERATTAEKRVRDLSAQLADVQTRLGPLETLSQRLASGLGLITRQLTRLDSQSSVDSQNGPSGQRSGYSLLKERNQEAEGFAWELVRGLADARSMVKSCPPTISMRATSPVNISCRDPSTFRFEMAEDPCRPDSPNNNVLGKEPSLEQTTASFMNNNKSQIQKTSNGSQTQFTGIDALRLLLFSGGANQLTTVGGESVQMSPQEVAIKNSIVAVGPTGSRLRHTQGMSAPYNTMEKRGSMGPSRVMIRGEDYSGPPIVQRYSNPNNSRKDVNVFPVLRHSKSLGSLYADAKEQSSARKFSTLKIVVFEARGLHWKDVDPYCSVRVNSLQKYTNVLSLCPADAWNETFIFEATDDEKDLVIDCWNAHQMPLKELTALSNESLTTGQATVDESDSSDESDGSSSSSSDDSEEAAQVQVPLDPGRGFLGRILLPIQEMTQDPQTVWHPLILSPLDPSSTPSSSGDILLSVKRIPAPKKVVMQAHPSATIRTTKKEDRRLSFTNLFRFTTKERTYSVQNQNETAALSPHSLPTSPASLKVKSLESSLPTPLLTSFFSQDKSPAKPKPNQSDRPLAWSGATGSNLDPLEEESPATLLEIYANSDPPDLDGIAGLIERNRDGPAKGGLFDRAWTNENAQTMLHLMTIKGSPKHLSMVLAYSELSAVDGQGQTALHGAAERGHLDCLKILVAAGLDVNAEDSFRLTPLHLAAQNGHRKVVECLIEKGSAVDYLDANRATPLFKAACRGHLSCVKLLLERGAMINREDKFGNNAMLAAAMENEFEVATFLRKKGLSALSQNKAGDSLLWAAVLHESLTFINFLLSSASSLPSSPSTNSTASTNTQPLSPSGTVITSADILNQTMAAHRFTVLHRAIQQLEDKQCEKMMSPLLKKGLRVDGRTDEEKTGLFLAAYYRKIETLRLLLKRGADPAAIDIAGNSALHFASSPEAVNLIVDALPRGKSLSFVNLQNVQENTPLHAAYVFFGEDVVKVLKQRGADENNKNRNGNTPSQCAWTGMKKIAFPFSAKDDAFPECGGLYISKVN